MDFYVFIYAVVYMYLYEDTECDGDDHKIMIRQ